MRFNSSARSEDGFTLIELFVVILLIATLAAIAIPVFLSQRHKAYDSSAQSDLRNLAVSEDGYLSDNPALPYATAVQLAATVDRLAVSPQNSVWVFRNGAQGYCLVGHNTNSSVYLVYNSLNGGLQKTSYTTQAAANTACTDVGYTAAGSIVSDSSGMHVS
jgi:type IV pilus assembly protein PilA